MALSARRRATLQGKAFAKAGKLFEETPRSVGKAWRKRLSTRTPLPPLVQSL